jgi:hypothetical protein
MREEMHEAAGTTALFEASSLLSSFCRRLVLQMHIGKLMESVSGEYFA